MAQYDECIFCRIVKGEIPCHRIYEDNSVLAFLDINPVNKGHTLILPKKHIENILDISPDDMKDVSLIAKNLAIRYKPILNATGFNILNASGKDAQQSVNHFYMHLAPRYPDDGIDLWFHPKEDLKIELKGLAESLDQALKKL